MEPDPRATEAGLPDLPPPPPPPPRISFAATAAA